ncbi:MAG TPA: hypothetical protein VM432_10125 [Bdellovibrionales bacterium]|nr:hypothetical protein [Bdellovibrionales bacterium]
MNNVKTLLATTALVFGFSFAFAEEAKKTDQQSAQPAAAAVETEMTATFGSTSTSGLNGCKTEELSKDVIKELKSDCNAWVKDQKADLKDRFRTSKCEEKCSDCAASLRRCNVLGTVRYIQ